MAAKAKIEYKVKSVNQFEDPNDQLVVGGTSRPKRKVQVQLEPIADSASGVFSSMNVEAQTVAYRAAAPVNIELTFTEVEGAFPWGIGDKIVLSKE